MRALLPSAGSDAAVLALYTDIWERAADHRARTGRPYLVLNMVSSVDGAISVEGKSAGLSGADDKAVFFHLRSLADVVLAGAGTVREENYGRVRTSDEVTAARRARGQQDSPRVGLVSRSMRFDPDMRLFQETRPYVVGPAGTAREQQEAAAELADVILTGDAEVDLADGMRRLGEAGADLVLCEGGPSLNGQLLAAGVVDELCLSLAPMLVGGDGHRIFGSAPIDPAHELTLLAVAEANGTLLLRYAVNSARQS